MTAAHPAPGGLAVQGQEPTQAAFTPPPWKTRKGFMSHELEVFHPDRAIKKPFMPSELATVDIDSKEGRANARLIVAAPDLFAFAEWCISKQFDSRELSTRARAALSRATGN
jgi:hypothetical protein